MDRNCRFWLWPLLVALAVCVFLTGGCKNRGEWKQKAVSGYDKLTLTPLEDPRAAGGGSTYLPFDGTYPKGWPLTTRYAEGSLILDGKPTITETGQTRTTEMRCIVDADTQKLFDALVVRMEQLGYWAEHKPPVNGVYKSMGKTYDESMSFTLDVKALPQYKLTVVGLALTVPRSASEFNRVTL